MVHNIDLSKINLLQISNIELARVIDKQIGIGLFAALRWARSLKTAFELGEIRGRALRK